MKKSILHLALAGLTVTMLAGSCAYDEEPIDAGDGRVTLHVSLPDDFITRQYGSGDEATKLQYVVYNKGTLTVLGSGSASMKGGSADLELELAAGATYDIAFWADAGDNSPYKFDYGTCTVKADYSKSLEDNEYGDCFYAVETNFVVNASNATRSITLVRPVTQINFGTSDFTSLTVQNLYGTSPKVYFNVEIDDAYTTFDLMKGVPGNQENVITAKSLNPAGETFPNPIYTYLDMVYVFSPAVGQVTNLTYNAYTSNEDDAVAAQTVTVGNVALRPNYRTNIYGNLLTTKTGFQVSVDPGFGQSSVWNGTDDVVMPTPDSNGNYTITSAAEFAGLAKMMNDEENPQTFEGKTITLITDIDLNGNEWTPMGKATRSGNGLDKESVSFKGTFDGQGHTINNLKMIIPSTTGKDQAIGFIGSLEGGTVKNLFFTNVNVQAPSSQLAGAAVGMVSNDGVVENVHVLGGSVTGNSVGGVVGRVVLSGSINNCTNAATVTGSGFNVGGITGAAYYSASGKTINISYCRNIGTVKGVYDAAGIVGFSCANVSGCSNSGNITADGSGNEVGIAGGIVAEQQNAGSITECVNTGTISSPTSNPAGGIVGWIRYNGIASAYPYKELIKVTKCINHGDITGSGSNSSSGGIVGLIYNYGYVAECQNFAKNISATVFAAGVVGGGQYLPDNVVDNLTGLPDVKKEYILVERNLSTTPIENITGNNKALYIYINGEDTMTAQDNVSTQEAFEELNKVSE